MAGALERWEDFEAARLEWSGLADQAGNLFATWEWADAWRRHAGPKGVPHVFAVRDGSRRLTAILPLWLTTIRGLRLARFIGHDAGDHLGPIHAAGAEHAAAGGLIQALDELAPAWDVLLAENLPAQARWEHLLGAGTLRRDSTASVPIDGQTWSQYLAHRSGRLRRLRTYERRLARDHTVRYRLADSPGRLDDDLDALFALHAMRWGAHSPGLGPARRAFHGDFAARALERGWLRLWFLEVDGSPVAAWYGFRFGGAEWAYQGGRDPSWDRASVGSLLLAHTLREAFQDGQHEYKMLRGSEGYKQRFASEAGEVVTLVRGRGVRGRAAARLAREAAQRAVVARTLRRSLGAARWRALGGAG
jgi:CelD/BcsL family acetyltransferase involved in cellulose biosynthesis